MTVFSHGVKIKKGPQSLQQLRESLMLLLDVEVLAGFPEETTERPDDPDDPEAKKGITNAALAYIHDQGQPEVNIPQREFMAPAMHDAQGEIADGLSAVLVEVVNKGAGPLAVEQGMHRVGSIAQLAIQNKINEGIDPPLADSTVRARARKGRKGAKEELANRRKGLPPSKDLAKPLVDTGELLKAANYAIRSRKKRSK